MTATYFAEYVFSKYVIKHSMFYAIKFIFVYSIWDLFLIRFEGLKTEGLYVLNAVKPLKENL